AATSGPNVTISGSGTGTLTLTLGAGGVKSDLNTVLQSLVYTTNSQFSGVDQLVVETTDADGLSDRDTTNITVNADDRPVTVMGSIVNEASPYVMFEVTGSESQWVSLELSQTTNANGNAATGSDFLPNLQYFDGTAWVSYTNGLIQIPDTATNNGKLLVRTAVLQDSIFETTTAGYETLKLTARNASGTANVTTDATNVQADGTAQIRDDGQGSIFLGNNSGTNNALSPNTSGDTDPNGPNYPAYLDDDRPVIVDNVVVNEASPWAMFTVTGYANQVLSLQLSDGTATVGDGSPADGTEDYSPTLEYWNGAAWAAYNGTSVTMSGSSLLVRTAVHQDDLFEGQHVFNLGVTKLSSNTTVYGTASIYDDGTGNIYAFNGGTPTITSGPGVGFDDDRTLTINSPLVNEGSDYVVFTLEGDSGQTVTLALQDESANGTVSGKANILENQILKIWDGLSWVDYDSTNLPTFDANGKIFVRVDIVAEQDDPYEGAETFKLNATLTGTSTEVTGVATIIDDGTGVKFPGTFTNGGPTTSTSDLDDDRATDITVTGGNYNENSPRAVFTVNATSGQVLTLDVQNAAQSGKAPTGDNEGKPNDSLDTADIYYSLDGGSTWQLYSGPITAGNVPILVAVDITNERDDVYEGEEQLKLVVTSGSQTASGYSSIFDDGTGTVTQEITDQTQNDTGANDPTVTKDDDRTISVTGYGPVNEGSRYAMFTVTATPGQSLDLALQDATSGTAATHSGFTYEFSTDGVNWTTYDATHKPTAPSNGKVYVRVDIGSEADAPYEGAETFALKASFTSNTSVSGAADTTIVDDGTGTKYGPGFDPTNGPTTSTEGLDDDRPKSIVVPAPPPPLPVQPAIVEASLTIAPVAPQIQSFASALAPADPPIPLGQVLTSDSGRPFIVSETAPPGLSLYQGITDQFVQSTTGATEISIPFDAFIHTDKNAVIKLTAKQADDSNLPSWVEFDPAAGTFTVKPPADFKGKLDLKVIARDDNGNEAVSIFQMFIGEQETKPAERLDSRNSFTEKLRMAGKRPITLVRVADVPQPVQDRVVVQRVSAG
ncbi:MAG: hypothetical protein RL357_1856, partial [Pseudomonadota bacterium]